MDEDIGKDETTQQGTCAWNPNFGTTGNPSDYKLNTMNAPPTPFDITKTNDTITNAGRSPAGTLPPTVPATFPTYSYGNTDF